MEESGFVYGDTTIEGIVITLKDGTQQFIKAKKPIIYKTAEENNKR